MISVARVRRVAASLTLAFFGLFLTAAPAAATSSLTWVSVGNDGPDPVLVAVTQGVGFTVNVTHGCETAPPEGISFAVCLPGGGYLLFTSTLSAPATD